MQRINGFIQNKSAFILRIQMNKKKLKKIAEIRAINNKKLLLREKNLNITRELEKDIETVRRNNEMREKKIKERNNRLLLYREMKKHKEKNEKYI